ncbi:hypothetical protein QFC21_003321 [Naganishia friedmannii]|uniref:Uncharacterized protein n=1 Tax=Naganishia friedmannii TaxID=89922 RepID=A0ACC2VPT1_9TREE|nr:hypothetical protein QFC21_003321 [Naganishia friedmannii]
MSSKAIGPDDKIPCPAVETLLWELEKLEEALEGAEKEETWERFERGILRFAAVTRGGGHKFTEVYIEGMGVKGLGPRVVECMLSDRGRLSGVATDFLTSMAPRLGPNFSSLIPLYIPPTIRLLARPNKVYLRRAEKCLLTIVAHCPLPSLITLIRFGTQDKNEACRRSCGGALERILREWDRELIGNKGLVELEVAMKRMATEKDAEVRKIGKRMWENYAAKWPERIEEFTAPLTPTIKKYLDISQTKSTTSRTLFNAPAVRVKHPLSQTTTASSEPIARPTLTSRHASSSSSLNKDRNLQAIRGLGRTAENGGSQQTVPTVNGMKPFLLRSTSAMVTSSTNTGRAGMFRSASAANVFGEKHLVEEEDNDEDDFSAEITPSTFTTRPRVLTHASTPELTGAAIIRSQAQRGAGGLTSGGAPARRARIVSGLTQVAEGRAGSSSGEIGVGRPQGAVRPTGRVVSSSATIGVGSRIVSGAKASDGRAGHASAIKPKMLVTSVLEQKKASGSSSVSSSTASKVEREDLPAGEDEVPDGSSPVEDSTVKTMAVSKTITTYPGGTVKTRQFFRPTPTATTAQASLHTSTASNTSAASAIENRPLLEQRRTASKMAGGMTRAGGGVTAPTASSGAKVVHRALHDSSKQQPTNNGLGHARELSVNSQQPQAKLAVSPRKPKPKLKPPVPAFMPVSRNRTAKDGKTPSSTLAPGEVRARINAHTRVKVGGVEPANIPLPASPAARLRGKHTDSQLQSKSAVPKALVKSVAPAANEDMQIAETDIALPPSHQKENIQPLLEEQAAADKLVTAEVELPTASTGQGAIPSSVSCASTVPPVLLTDVESADEGDLSHGSVTFKKKNDQGLRETLARASATRAMANEQNVPPPTSTAEVNLIDFSDSDSPQKSSVRLEPRTKRTPLGPASPNQQSVKKAASVTPASPKVKQLQDFFEKRAFSPSPSPERLPTTTSPISPRRASTTPTATPPRPRVLG